MEDDPMRDYASLKESVDALPRLVAESVEALLVERFNMKPKTNDASGKRKATACVAGASGAMSKKAQVVALQKCVVRYSKLVDDPKAKFRGRLPAGWQEFETENDERHARFVEELGKTQGDTAMRNFLNSLVDPDALADAKADEDDEDDENADAGDKHQQVYKTVDDIFK